MDNDIINNDRRTLGQALRILRNRAGISQKETTTRGGIDDTYVSRLEHGLIDIKWSTLLRLLRALDADLRQLADAVDEAEKEDPPAKVR